MSNYQTPKEAEYKFTKFLGNREVVFQNLETRQHEVFGANKNHAGWALKWRNTHWEFCRSISLADLGYVQGKKIEVTMFYFGSEKASSLTSFKKKGTLTEVDEKSTYCNWNDENGKSQPCVTISCIKLL